MKIQAIDLCNLCDRFIMKLIYLLYGRKKYYEYKNPLEQRKIYFYVLTALKINIVVLVNKP